MPEKLRVRRSGVPKRLFLISWIVIVCFFPAGARQRLTVTAYKGALQQFGGFGMHKGARMYPEALRDTLCTLFISDLKVTHARFFASFYIDPLDAAYLSYNDIVNFALIEMQTDRQNKVYADGVYNVADFMRANPDLFYLMGFATDSIKDSSVVAPYAGAAAQWIKKMRAENIDIRWTGLVNEPQDHDRVALDVYPYLMKQMRIKLDSAGLEDIKIYGPEVSNVDAKAQ